MFKALVWPAVIFHRQSWKRWLVLRSQKSQGADRSMGSVVDSLSLFWRDVRKKITVVILLLFATWHFVFVSGPKKLWTMMWYTHICGKEEATGNYVSLWNTANLVGFFWPVALHSDPLMKLWVTSSCDSKFNYVWHINLEKWFHK